MPGVEHHSRKAACQPAARLGGEPLTDAYRPGRCASGVPTVMRTGRFVRFLILLPGALGDGLQYRECFSAAHKLCVLAAPEALAAGKQPDGF